MLLRIMQVVFGLSFAALWLIVLVKTFAWSCQGETTTLKMVINFLGAGGAPCGSWWIKWITPWGETATIDAPASGERGFAGAGSQRCQILNERAVPGRGSDQNNMTMFVFTWAQGYMSGFNGYSLMINKGYVNLGAVSAEVQWEHIVSHCRSHPADYIVQAVQSLQVLMMGKVNP